MVLSCSADLVIVLGAKGHLHDNEEKPADCCMEQHRVPGSRTLTGQKINKQQPAKEGL